MKKLDGIVQSLSPEERAELSTMLKDTGPTVEDLKQQYNDAETRRDFVGMNAIQNQIKKLKMIGAKNNGL